jgi:thiol:disulfide interchange protein DsbD
MKHLALSALAALSWVSASFAASPAPTASFRYHPETFKGDTTRLVVKVAIPKGWHIQSDAPLDEFLIPTELKAEGEGLKFGKAVYPKPILEEFPALGGNVALFAGNIEIKVPVTRITAKNGVKVKPEALEAAKVTLRYQACNESQCLPPKEITARFEAKSGK